MADFSVKFNNYDLNLIPNLEFYRRFPNNEAEIALTEYDIIRREGSVITDSKHKSKIITLEGYIQAPTRVAYEQALDELKFRTSGTNKRLIIQQGGSDRVYEATKENIIDKHIEAGKSEISVSFRCSDPLGSSALPQIDSFSTTSASFSLPHEFVGTAPTYPIISIGYLS